MIKEGDERIVRYGRGKMLDLNKLEIKREKKD